jgi:methionyl-tRNA formyltransferase
MRILFLGTPDFSVPSLELLHNAGHEIVAAVTAPDKPAGRGLHLHQSPVKRYAAQHGLKVLQPEKLRDESFLSELRALEPEVGVVVAFRKLPEAVWALPLKGTFNLHASLLPEYRWAAPINWAIINGETETGLTTFFLTHEIDTGKIILQQRISIGSTETAGELHDRMKATGAVLVLQTVKAIEEGTVKVIEQPLHDQFRRAPKIFTEDCRINFHNTAFAVFNLIRGLSPSPGAFTLVNGNLLKIFRARISSELPDAPPGTMTTDNRTFLRFACADAWIEATEVQLQGKKRMKTDEFLRGHRLT